MKHLAWQGVLQRAHTFFKRDLCYFG